MARLDYPATRRNRDAILRVLRETLPERGRVLEVASGSGQHVAHFAAHLTELRWQPTDLDAEVLPSIAAWTEGLANVAPPVRLDVTTPDWPAGPFDGLFCANMIHISPWASCQGLFAGGAKVLRPNATMCLYGPFKRNGRHTSPSNHSFDASLQTRNSDWGVRDIGEVENEAKTNGIELNRVIEMPANNLILVFHASP